MSTRTPMRRSVPALLAVGAVLLVAAAAVLAASWLRPPDDGRGPPLGAVLDEADRRAVGAVPVRRGAPPLPVDPSVDPTDPVAVARAYLVAARTADPADAGRTQLRAAAYALPGSPPAAVGVLVLDAPSPGQVRTAAVTALDLAAADDADLRRGYHATVTTTTAPHGARTVAAAYVVLARQPDGRWLITADTPDPPEGDE